VDVHPEDVGRLALDDRVGKADEVAVAFVGLRPTPIRGPFLRALGDENDRPGASSGIESSVYQLSTVRSIMSASSSS